MKTQSFIKLSALVIALTFTVNAIAGGSSSVGPANPAAVLCKKAGGKSYRFATEAGEASLCQFGRGMVEEWTLFRFKTTGQVSEAIAAFLKWPEYQHEDGVNPSMLYCEQVGGLAETVNVDGGSELGVCVFKDGSIIDAWTLFRGPQHETNRKLVKYLRK